MTGSEVRGESPNKEEDFPITRLECCIYKDTTEPFFETGVIYEKDVATWLASKPKQSPGQPSDAKAAVAALRLVWLEHTYAERHPFSSNTRQKVHRALGIPQIQGSYLLDVGSVSGKYSVTETQSGIHPMSNQLSTGLVRKGYINWSVVFISYRSASIYTNSFIINHDSISNITMGYVLFGPVFREAIGDILNTVQEQYSSYPHPLLVPTILSETAVRGVAAELIQVHVQLRDVEILTGFGNWGERAAGTALNFPKPTRELGVLSLGSSSLDLSLRTTLLRIEFMLEELKLKSESGNVGSVENMMRQRIAFLKGRLEHLLLYRAIKSRLQTQQTVVSILLGAKFAGSFLED